MEAEYFGEGSTIFKGFLYVISWKEKTAFKYNKDNLDLIEKYTFNSHSSEG